jgi:hypothetical protein
MDWLAWYASRHTWLVHLPAVCAFLLIFPAIAAQRGGRGIRPWWTTCRYLGWIGFVGAVLTVGSGLLSAWGRGLLDQIGAASVVQPGLPHLFRIHALGGAATLLLGGACLRSLYRKRQDYQGIGVPALLLAILWGCAALGTVYTGRLLNGRSPAPARLLGTSAPTVVQAPPYRR